MRELRLTFDRDDLGKGGGLATEVGISLTALTAVSSLSLASPRILSHPLPSSLFFFGTQLFA